MRKSRKLLMLSGVLGLVLAAGSVRPALALCYFCSETDPCTQIEITAENSVCCPRGHGPTCSELYDSNGCLVSVTTTGCS